MRGCFAPPEARARQGRGVRAPRSWSLPTPREHPARGHQLTEVRVHPRRIRLPAREELEAAGRLPDVHVPAVDGVAADAPRRLQQRGLERNVDDVRHPHRGPEQLRRHRQPGRARHSRRRRMDEAAGAAQRRPEVRGSRSRDRRRSARSAARRGPRPAGRPGRRPRGAPAPRRSTASAHAEPAPPAPSSTTRERSASGRARRNPQLQPAPSVLWPDESIAPAHDGVHRADGAHLLGQLVEQRDHRLLARIGDVQPGEAHDARRLDQRGQDVRAAAGSVEVDQLVVQTHAVVPGLLFLQRRRQRALDAGADEPAEQRSSMARTLSVLVAEEPRQEQHEPGHERDQRERADHHDEKRHHLAHEVPQRHVGDLHHHEQQQAVGRRDQPDHDVHDRHHAEMHRVDAERLRGGQQHRHDDQEDRVPSRKQPRTSSSTLTTSRKASGEKLVALQHAR